MNIPIPSEEEILLILPGGLLSASSPLANNPFPENFLLIASPGPDELVVRVIASEVDDGKTPSASCLKNSEMVTGLEVVGLIEQSLVDAEVKLAS